MSNSPSSAGGAAGTGNATGDAISANAVGSAAGNAAKPALIAPGFGLTFVVVTALFFLWAFPNILNDVLIKQFKKALELDMAQAGFLPFALKTGYFFLAIPAGLFMQRWGYKTGILLGLGFFALGCLLFYPAACSREYIVFLGAIFIMAGGCAFLEIGANSFVVALGDKATSERRLNLAQSFNPIGGIVAATLGTVFIFSGNEPDAAKIAAMKADTSTVAAGFPNAYEQFLSDENMRVFPTYLTLAIVIAVVAAIIWKAKFPAIAAPVTDPNAKKGSIRELLRFPHWWGAIVSQFFYLGAQLGTWSFLIIYIQDNSPLGEKQAGAFLVANMVIFMVGRFLSTWLMNYVKPQKLMGIYALVNIALVAVAILGSKWAEVRFGLGLHNIAFALPAGIFDSTPVPLGIYALTATTLFMSLMYPTNFASGMKGLGPNAKLGASILVMSLIGGAVLSAVIGQIGTSPLALMPADAAAAAAAGATGAALKPVHAIAPGLLVPIVSYCVIAWYAFIGSRPRGPLYA
ncbi:MAG: sugar MFS transporter [Puniceicoccales bacterium]|jgi:FHS family L-fucose permease-like MFS transporter|nr:sugar MFS transporter [Puniceicoccales bacterium]